MKKRTLASAATVAIAASALLMLAFLLGGTNPGGSSPVLAAPSQITPTVALIHPAYAPNDLDTDVTITGTDFVSTPAAYLGDTSLEVTWASSTRLEATVPWGLEPGAYTLRVENPGGERDDLANAFTVTQGIGMWTTGGPYGGRVEQVVVHPVTPTTVYAAVGGVGVFVSSDAADTWDLMLSNDWVTRLASDAENRDVIYVGSDSGRFVRSLDGGETWELLPALFHSQNGCYRTYPAPHPTEAQTIFLGVGQCEGIPLAPGEGGVYYSPDYGDSWFTRTLNLTDTDIVDLAFHPDDPDTMAAATFAGNVFTTTDAGLHWHFAADLEEQLRRIAFNPIGAHEAWVVPHAEFQPPSAPYLYKSVDPSLSTWITTVVTDELVTGGGIWSLTFVSDTVWAAGDLGYVSDDGGTTWTPVMRGEYAINTVKSFAFPTSDDQTVYAGSEMDGVATSTDGGATWRERNQGLAGLQIRGLAVPAQEIDTVYANTFEKGLLRSDNAGQGWQELAFFHGGRPKGQLLSADPFVLDRAYLGHGCDGLPCVQVSEDRGLTWREVTMTLPVTWTGQMGEVMVALPHPLVPGRMLAGVGFCRDTAHCNTREEPSGIYTSDDYGESWSYVGPTPPISEVASIAYDAINPDLVYAGTLGMGVWKSVDQGASWSAAPIPGVPSPVHVADIESHPDVSGTVYVRVYSYAAGPNPQPRLFLSEDAGATWQELSDVDTVFGGMGGIGLVFTPPAPDSGPYTLYSGCGPGLCRSPDGGETWEAVEGAPRPELLTAVSDGERAILYMSSSGGLPTSIGLQADRLLDAIPGGGSALTGGVYRLTTRLQHYQVYLPCVLKDPTS